MLSSSVTPPESRCVRTQQELHASIRWVGTGISKTDGHAPRRASHARCWHPVGPLEPMRMVIDSAYSRFKSAGEHNNSKQQEGVGIANTSTQTVDMTRWSLHNEAGATTHLFVRPYEQGTA